MNYEDFRGDFFGGASLVGLPLLSFEHAIRFLCQYANILGTLTERELEYLPEPRDNIADALRLSLRPSVSSALDHARNHFLEPFAAGRLHAMTVDEVAAINLYTQETVLYFIINRVLGGKRNHLILPCLPYIKLLLTALYKLPPVVAHVDRGVALRLDSLDEEYANDGFVTWWRFSSTTRTIGTLEDFLNKESDGTVFTVDILTGVDIKSFSSHDQEDEVLLLPGTTYRVHSTVVLAENERMQLQMAQLKETSDESQLGYTRKDFQEEYVARQIPRWCCRPGLYAVTSGWLPVEHPLLATRLQQHSQFFAKSESQCCGLSVLNSTWVLIVEFLMSFRKQVHRAIVILVFLLLTFFIFVLVADAHMNFPSAYTYVNDHPQKSAVLAVSLAFVIIPCVQCYYVSQYRGCWDIRRWAYGRFLQMQLRQPLNDELSEF